MTTKLKSIFDVKRPWLVAGGALSAGLAAFLVFRSLGSPGNSTASTLDLEPLPAVGVTESQAQEIKRVFKTYGTLQPWKEVSLRPPLQNTVRTILVKVGDRVDIQQPLIISGSEVQVLKSELEKVDFDLKSLDYNVSMALAKKNFLSRNEARQRALEHRATLLRAQISRHESTGSLRSPIQGVISDLGFKEGDYIDQSSTAVVKVSDNSKLKVPMYVPQDIIRFLEVGAMVELKRPGSSASFFARISIISPTVDSKTGSVFIELAIDEIPQGILAGMYTEIEIPLEKASQAITVPSQAVVYENGSPFVYRIKSDQTRTPAGENDLREIAVVEKVPVRLGIKNGDLIQISEGIEDLDQIVVQGLGSLSSGTSVEVIR